MDTDNQQDISACKINLDDCFTTAIDIAKEHAGPIIRRALTGEKTFTTKESIADVVTETDGEVEHIILTKLKTKYPSHHFIAEESVESKGCELTNNPTWVIDPIDGTANFVHGFPNVAVCIALMVNKRTEIGIVYDVLHDKLFTAQPGRGAFCNGKRLKVSGHTDLNKSLVFAEIPRDCSPETVQRTLKNFESLMLAPVQGFRALGSAALDMCAVAEGSMDAYFDYGPHIWDFAGAELIREAGGVTMDTEGGPVDLMSRRILVASSHALAKAISCKLIHTVLPRD
uniref:Inositol-1-monophosphatase n=1 Tax=Saccoglossus kowalevskii TaxID=10224 RepID=A0ABM0M4T6_SACKO|nr:PREDICTED: LOW QUALITY PROTEIN: inositol monophosphatase 1-like [Saccoglossus kowalevskii]